MSTSRKTHELRYTNEDGMNGSVLLHLPGPWGFDTLKEWGDAPLMLDLQDAVWMGDAEIALFRAWLDEHVPLSGRRRLELARSWLTSWLAVLLIVAVSVLAALVVDAMVRG